MKSLYASIAVVSVLWVSGATAAARWLDTAPPQQAAAQPESAPILIPINGRLTTPTGEPRAGSVVMVVSLYASRDDVTPLWIEHQLVTLDNTGGYSILAGATLDDGVPKEHFRSGSGRWLGVGVQGEAEQPRVMLVSVPYALKAVEADTLAGRTATDFVLRENLGDTVRSALRADGGGSDPGIMATTTNTLAKFTDSGGTVGDSDVVEVNGKVGIGTTTPADRLEIYGDSRRLLMRAPSAGGQTGIRMISANGGDFVSEILHDTGNLALRTTQSGMLTTRLYIGGDGNIGIGTTSPANKLEIFGDASRLVMRAATAGGLTGIRMIGGNSNTFVSEVLGDTGNLYFRTTQNGSLATRLFVGGDGNIGIGTSTPTARLQIAGNVVVDGNIGAKYQDVAEWVETAVPLAPGTVVIVDPLNPNSVQTASRAYDTRVAGAVSQQPGLLLGEPGDTKAMVAQSGRVRVKSDAQYGAIKIGDLLVTSPTPGHAMRSRPMRVGKETLHRPGTLLGKALEALPRGKGQILVLLTLQ